jgi:hypothetical protein
VSGGGQNAGTSHLKLVFAPVGPTPQVGSAAAAPAKGTEILALPEAFANQVIANGPNSVPDTVVAAGRQAAGKFISDANKAASELVALATSPTLLDVLQLPINTAWQIGAGINLPKSPLVPTPFTSLLTVSNSALMVALLPLTIANLAIYGHIEDIPATVMNTINTASTSLFQGLPASVNGIVQYDLSVLQQFATGLGAATVNSASSASSAAVSPKAAASTLAAAAAPTLLDVLQLPINTAWQIGAGGLGGIITLPDSPLIPKPYTSVLKAAGDALQVGILPLTVLNLAIYGQIQKIPDTITKTINTAATSLFVGLPASIMGTLQYDASVLQQFFNPVPAQAAAVNAVAKNAGLAVSPAAAAVAGAPTLLDVLQLPLQTAWQIGAGGLGGSFITLPDSPLVPKPFTSVLKAAGDSLQVAILPLTVLNLAIYGQIQKIPGTINSTINTAVTSVFQGLPASIAGILKYDASVVQAFMAGVPVAAPNVTKALAKSTTESVQKKSPTDGAAALKSGDTTDVKDVSDEHADDNGKKDATGEKPSTGTSTDGGTTTDPSGTSPSGTTGSTGGTTGSTGTTGSASGSTGKDGSTGSGTTGTHSGTTGGSTGKDGSTGNDTTGNHSGSAGGASGTNGSTGHHPKSNGGNGGGSNGRGTGGSHAKGGQGSHHAESHKSAK